MHPILMYHYLGSPPPPGAAHSALTVPPKEFEEQLNIIQSMKLKTVDSREYTENLTSQRSAVWLTFDDGQIDNYEIAVPLLKKAGMKATFFIVSEWALQNKNGYIPISGLREMLAEGMEIGCHSATHPMLAKLSSEKLHAEVADSKKKLEDSLQVEIKSFCYPYGSWNKHVIKEVRDAGYELALSTIRDNRNAPADRWHLRRVMVQPGRTGMRFRYLFSPLYHWVHERKNKKRWKELAE